MEVCFTDLYPPAIEHKYRKSSSLMGKLTISMIMFNNYVDKSPEGNWWTPHCTIIYQYLSYKS